MAKLPGVADLGPAPNADPTRPVGSFDAAPFARGGQALAEGAKALGQGITQAGVGAEDLALDESRFQYAKAHSDAVTGMVGLDAATAQDMNPGPDASGKTLPQRYADQLSTIVGNAASQIELGPMRDRFLTDFAPHIERGVVTTQTRATALQNNGELATLTERGNAATNQFVTAADEQTRAVVVDAHSQLIDRYAAMAGIPPTQALQMKQAWVQQSVRALVAAAKSSGDPELLQAAVNQLTPAASSGDDVTGRILGVEGTGRNPKSTAQGTGQFIDSTWLDVLKRNRPDLAQGRSDADLLALRADRQLGAQMTDAYRRENASYLQAQGIEATPGAQYLAHFLGPGGAAAVLKADPNRPVADVLTEAVGAKQAQAMITANPSILGGQLVGSVKQWADNKMGGQAPGAGSVFDVLPPAEREELRGQLITAQQKQNANDLSVFNARIQDNQAEAINTGAVKVPIAQSEFVAHFGADVGPKAYAQHQAVVQLGADMQSVANMDPNEQGRLLASYTPQAGDGYAAQLQRQIEVRKAIDRVNKAKDDDPAGFAIARLPATGDAYKAFNAVLGDPNASDDERQAAAQHYASVSRLEQQRVGIPADSVRILPQGYVDRFNGAIAAAHDSDDPKARVGLIARVRQEAQLWGGENWPSVMQQLTPTALPIVRAIAAGSDPTAMVRLLNLPKDEARRPATILAQQNDEKWKDLVSSLNDELAPFRRTMVGRQLDRDYPAFLGLAKELGAIYVRDGKSASEGAAAAYKALLGNLYEIRDTYRVPRDVGVSADDVQAGAQMARSQLGTFDVAPFFDDLPGRRDATEVDLALVARDGRWVTSPNNSGLNLVYDTRTRGAVAIRQNDGTPLLLTWGQLAAFGRDRPMGTHREYLARHGIDTALGPATPAP